MLKNLEIINELHEYLIEKGFVLTRKQFCMIYNLNTMEVQLYFDVAIFTLHGHIPGTFYNIHDIKKNYIKYNTHKSINKILNKVDEWMRK